MFSLPLLPLSQEQQAPSHRYGQSLPTCISALEWLQVSSEISETTSPFVLCGMGNMTGSSNLPVCFPLDI